MTDNQLIDQLATDAYVHSSGVAKYPATIIYKATIQQLKEICEAYHQAKCAESETVGRQTSNGTNQAWQDCTKEVYEARNKYLDEDSIHWLWREIFDKLQSSDAEANLKIAREALEAILIGQITKDYNLLLSTVGMAAIAKQALEKIGDEVKLTKQEVSILHKAHKKSVTVIRDECNGTGQVLFAEHFNKVKDISGE